MADAALDVSSNATDPPPPVAVHELVASLQALHGLRPDRDYGAYHSYLTARLRRVRKQGGFKQSKGKGAFVPKALSAADVGKAPSLLVVPLLEAERAWASGMEVKQTLESGPKQGHSRLASHMYSRLRKGAAHAKAFDELCAASGADERTRVEATAYAWWMESQLRLEQEQWQAALDSLSKCLAIVQPLSEVGTLEQMDLFGGRVDSCEQTMRYCRYNLGGDSADPTEATEKSAIDNPEVAAALEVVVAKAREDSGGSSSSDGAVHIVWRGKQVSLRTALLRDAVLKAQHLSTEVATATAAAATAANDSAAKDTAEPSGKGGNKHNSIAPGPSKALLGKCVSAFDDLLTLLQQLVSELESKGQVINGGGGGSGGGLRGSSRLEAERSDLDAMHDWASLARACHLAHKYRKIADGIAVKWRTVATAAAAAASQQGSAVASYSSGRRHLQEYVSYSEDLVHVYGALIAVLEEGLSLPGVEDDDDVIDALTARLSAARAHKCFYLAAHFAAPKKVEEGEEEVKAPNGANAARALYTRALTLAENAESQYRACLDLAATHSSSSSSGESAEGVVAVSAGVFEGLPQEMAGLAALQREVSGAQARDRASTFLASLSPSSDEANGGTPKVLLDRLDVFDAGLVIHSDKGQHAKKGKGKKKKNQEVAGGVGSPEASEAAGAGSATTVSYHVAKVPPALLPVATKPMLFNLAHNFLAFPNLDEKAGGPATRIVEEDDGKEAERGKGGGGGFLGWLLN